MASQSAYCSVMEQVLTVTQEMLRNAEQDVWDRVAELEAERVALLQDHGSLPSVEAEIARAANLVQQIQALNAQLLELGKQQIKSISGERQHIDRGRQAVAAYGR